MAGFARSSFHRRFLYGLIAVYALAWILLAINPISRQDWALENIVVAIGLLVLVVSWRWYVFSWVSYLCIAIFLVFHGIGAHYTYSQVPYDEWVQKLTGNTLNSWFGWDRNHYDRLVHFLYGVFLTLPFRETFLHFARVRWTFWTYLVPLSFVLATSLLYELLEWAAAEVLGSEEGLAFVGAQGDIWDAQIDSFGAMMGSLLTIGAIVLSVVFAGRDLAKEWVEAQEKTREPA